MTRPACSASAGRQRLASALNHPAICTIYEFAADERPSFIAMEYIEGVPLASRIQVGRLPLNLLSTMPTLSLLVINFILDPQRAVREMKRVTRRAAQ